MKIKTVENQKHSSVQKGFRRPQAVSDLPFDIRIQRDHGGGLWTMESREGQLYLAVLSRESSAAVARLQEARRASGKAYRLGRRGA